MIEKISDISTRMVVNKVALKYKKDEIFKLVDALKKGITKVLKELIYKGNYEELENKLHTRKTEISGRSQ